MEEPKIKTANQRLHDQFIRALLEAATKGLFKNKSLVSLFNISYDDTGKLTGITGFKKDYVNTSIERWKINTNSGGGDCVFLAIAQILNNTPGIRPRTVERQGDHIAMVPLRDNVVNPYVNRLGKYTVKSLRNAMVQYLLDNHFFTNEINETDENVVNNPATRRESVLENLRSTIPDNLPELADKRKNNETLTQIDKDFLDQYAFAINPKTQRIYDSVEEIANVMLIPTDIENETAPKLKKKWKKDGKYYWGDEIALFALEDIFNVVFSLITVPDKAISKTPVRNSRVSFQEDGVTVYGDVRAIDNESGTMTIVSDTYTSYQKEIAKVKLQHPYRIHDRFSHLVPDKDTRLAFLRFEQNNLNGHYESIKYAPPETTRSVQENYTYMLNTTNVTNALPSYLSFMIFKSVYGFNLEGEFGKIKDTVYDKLRYVRDVTDHMNNAYEHHRSSLQTPKDTPDPSGTQDLVKIHLGGQVGKFVTPYLQSSSSLNTKNTYYVVVDLDLYPGKDISSGDRFRLNCSNRYDKMRSAWADIVGATYEPGELDETRYMRQENNEAIPVAVPVKSGGSTTTRKANVRNHGSVSRKKRMRATHTHFSHRANTRRHKNKPSTTTNTTRRINKVQ
jgi:hypothetical protein